jgi:hypothetical protein
MVRFASALTPSLAVANALNWGNLERAVQGQSSADTPEC